MFGVNHQSIEVIIVALTLYSCSDKIRFLTPDDFESNLRDTLEQVRQDIPRVFVSVVEIFNLSLVWYMYT
jgi:hypothetical protein